MATFSHDTDASARLATSARARRGPDVAAAATDEQTVKAAASLLLPGQPSEWASHIEQSTCADARDLIVGGLTSSRGDLRGPQGVGGRRPSEVPRGRGHSHAGRVRRSWPAREWSELNPLSVFRLPLLTRDARVGETCDSSDADTVD